MPDHLQAAELQQLSDPPVRLLGRLSKLSMLLMAPAVNEAEFLPHLPGWLHAVEQLLGQWEAEHAIAAAALEERQREAGDSSVVITAAELLELALAMQLRMASELAHGTPGAASAAHIAAGRAAANALLRLGGCGSAAFRHTQLGELALDAGEPDPARLRTALQAAEQEKGAQ